MIKQPRGPFAPGDQVQLTDPKGRRHRLVLEAGRTFHTHRGSLAHDDLIGKPEGSVVVSSGGTAYVALRPLLADYTLSMTRGAAVVYPKDAGADRRPRPTSSPARAVVEAGAGSGALSCWLLRAVGEDGLLVSYERRPDFAEIARANVERYFGGPHPAWRLVVGEFPADGAVGILRDNGGPADDGDAFDRVVLDMLAPWEYADAAATRSGARRPGLLLRGHHHAAVAHRRGAAGAGQLRRAGGLGDRCSAAGTSTGWPSGPSTGWSATPDSW